MGRRNKNRFEKWFSFSRHKRRSGAKQLSDLISMDFHQQSKQLIAAGDVVYTHGSGDDIEEHFIALMDEFSGQSELCYTGILKQKNTLKFLNSFGKKKNTFF